MLDLQHLRRLWSFLHYVLERFEHNGGMQTAAALTYTTLFAVVPLMTVTYSMLSVVAAFQGVGEQIQSFVFDNFIPSVGAEIQRRLQAFSEQARELTGIGIVFLVVTAYMMLMNVEKAFNVIWAVRQPRKGLPRFLLYWAILTLSPLLIGAGFVVSSYLFSLPLISDAELFGLSEVTIALLPVLTSWVAFTIIYAAIPNTRVPLVDALVGALIATLLFESAKHGFAFFVRRSSMEVIYGTFAAVPLFLGWLYLTWIIVLVGAEIVHARTVRRFQTRHGGSAPLFVSLQFLERVHRQHRQGGGLPEVVASPILQQLGPDRLPSVLEGLVRADIVRRDSDGNWLPGRSFEVATLSDVYDALPGALIDRELLDDIEEGPAWTAALRDRVRAVLETRDRELDISLAELFEAREATPHPFAKSRGRTAATREAQ